MRVLIVYPYFTASGLATRVVSNLSPCLKRRGVQTSLLTLALPQGVQELLHSFSDIYLPRDSAIAAPAMPSIPSDPLVLLREIRTLASMLRRHALNYDVVYICGFPATWAVYGLPRPVIWNFNEPGEIRDTLRASALTRGLYGLGVRMDKIVVNKHIDTICVGDESNGERVLRRYGRQARLVPYGLNTGALPEARNEETRRRLGIEGRFVLLQPGMVSPAKNQLESLRVLKRLKEKIGNVVLVFAGIAQGGYKRLLDEYIKRQGLEKDVIFTGRVREGEARALYTASDVALFPEKTDSGWLYPLEVFSAGATLVTSAAYSASSVIAREGLGFVASDMAEAIEHIFRNPAKGRQVAKRAFEWLDRNFGWDNFAGNMMDVFENVVA